MFLAFPGMPFLNRGKAHVLHLDLVLLQHLKLVVRHPEFSSTFSEECDEYERRSWVGNDGIRNLEDISNYVYTISMAKLRLYYRIA